MTLSRVAAQFHTFGCTFCWPGSNINECHNFDQGARGLKDSGLVHDYATLLKAICDVIGKLGPDGHKTHFGLKYFLKELIELFTIIER